MSRKGFHDDETKSRSSDRGNSERSGEGGGTTRTHTTSGHQAVVADHEDFEELSSRTYVTFEEDKNVWAREIRNRPTGTAFLRLVDKPQLFDVNVRRSAAGYLAWDLQTIARELPEVLDDVNRLVEENFKSDIFVSPTQIDAETKQRLERILQPTITVQARPQDSASSATAANTRPSGSVDHFR